MTTKVIRVGAALAGAIVLSGFISQAQAQGTLMYGRNANGTIGLFRLPGTLPLGYGYGNGFGYAGGGGVGYTPSYAPQSSYATPAVSYIYSVGPNGGNSSAPNYGGGQATLSTSGGGGNDGSYSDPYMPNYSPAGGYLQGKADLTSSIGKFMVNTQKARLIEEEANRSQIDTRRRIWEEAKWERMNTVFTEDYREQLIKTEQRRARMEPPLNEIWSGRTLNVLVAATGAQQAKGVRGPSIPIHEDLLKHINLTSGANGNIGLFKNELQWPSALEGPEFAETVKGLKQRIPEAVQQAKVSGAVDSGLLKDVKQGVARLHEVLLRNVGEMGPGEYIEAKRFLNQLNEGVRALDDKNVSNYLTGKWAAKGRNVAELVDSLRAMGLEIAPASPGDEPAYRALYYALYSYDTGMNQMTGSREPPPPGSGSGDK